MKKILSFMVAIALVVTFGVFALGSGESEVTNQGSGSAGSQSSQSSDSESSNSKGSANASKSENDNNLSEYKIEIKECRLAKDFQGKDVVIVKYSFTNNSDESKAFSYTFEDNVYQNGVGLNESYVLDDSTNYSSDNHTKEIKKGASLDVEVAYELNDTTTDIEVEVKEFMSFNDSVVTKTFSIQ